MDFKNIFVFMSVLVLVVAGVGLITNYGYNFISMTDSKMYDDNNKYTDIDDPTTLTDHYEYNEKSSSWGLKVFDILNGSKRIFIPLFLLTVLLMVFISKKTSVFSKFRNMFNNDSNF